MLGPGDRGKNDCLCPQVHTQVRVTQIQKRPGDLGGEMDKGLGSREGQLLPLTPAVVNDPDSDLSVSYACHHRASQNDS